MDVVLHRWEVSFVAALVKVVLLPGVCIIPDLQFQAIFSREYVAGIQGGECAQEVMPVAWPAFRVQLVSGLIAHPLLWQSCIQNKARSAFEMAYQRCTFEAC